MAENDGADRQQGQDVADELVVGLDLTEKLALACLGIFVVAAALGGFLIGHRWCIGLFCLSGTSLVASLLLGYSPGPDADTAARLERHETWLRRMTEAAASPVARRRAG